MNTAIPLADAPPLIVLIPTHNRLSLLERTVDSVMACTPPKDRLVRIVIIENGGEFGVEQLLANKATWIKPEYYFFSKPNKSDALNSFLATIEDALVIFFDDDIRADPEILVHYSNAARGVRYGKFYGGGMLIDYEEPPPSWLLDHLPASATGWHPDADSYSGVAGKLAFMGCNWAAFSSDLKSVGGFNPQFGPGGTSGGTGQERAMQVALQQKGIVAEYVRDAVVWHYVPKSRCSVQWSLQRSYRNAITVGHELRIAENDRTIGCVPKRMIKLALNQGLGIVKSWLRDKPAIRYTKMSSFLNTYGMIKGIRERHKSDKRSI